LSSPGWSTSSARPLPGELHRPTLEDSLRHLAGALVTPELLDDTCWRLAGNLTRLRHRKAVPPWHGQQLMEWVPLQVLGCRRVKNARGRLGARLRFRIVAGTPCPRIVDRWWSMTQCRVYAPEFGFSRPVGRNAQPRHPYGVPEQLVSLRLYGLIEPQLCGVEPAFRVVGWPDSVADWNREVIRRRLRVDPGYTCPRGYPTQFQCHRCPAGYVDCLAATHKHEWRTGPCPECHRPDALFDPDDTGGLCVDCTIQGAYRHKPK
jgi:hypothetical protein